MSTVAEIEAAINDLPPHDFARLRDWLLERDHLLWDQQIVADAAAGRMNSVIKEIEDDIAAGQD